MATRGTKTSTLLAVIAILLYPTVVLHKPIFRRAQVLGITRLFSTIDNIHGQGLWVYDDAPGCEDIHYHAPSGLIYGAADIDNRTKKTWFPAAELFGEPESLPTGQLFVIDALTRKKTKLRLIDFKGPFIPHGFDIYSAPDKPEIVYIFVINHLPNPAHAVLERANVPKARSQVEVFVHETSTKNAHWLRSVFHPLLRTPNDIFAINERTLLITNDHYHREGLGRVVEDLGWVDIAPWSDLVEIQIDDLEEKATFTAGVSAALKLSGLANPNGLGHGSRPDEVLLSHASSGNLSIMQLSSGHLLTRIGDVQCPTTIDNPTYFYDPFPTVDRDTSGFVLAGLTHGVLFPFSHQLGSVVWLVDHLTHNARKIFQDDGRFCHSASTAIIIPLDPDANGGKKQAWLYIGGPYQNGLISTLIELFWRFLVDEIIASGDNIIGTARDPSRLQFEAATEKNHLAARLDVTDKTTIEGAFSAGLKKFGLIDVVVNNTGYGLSGPFEELDDKQIGT